MLSIPPENVCKPRVEKRNIGMKWVNPFLANDPILYAPENRKTFVFWCFQGRIKWEHWPKMG